MAVPIVDGVIFIKTLVDAMDGAGLKALEMAAMLVNYLRPVILTSFLLYIVLWGWAMMHGLITEIVLDGVTRIFKLAIVMGLVLGFGGGGTAGAGLHAIGSAGDNSLYIQYVYNFIWNGPEKIFEQITGHSTNTIVIISQALSFMYTLGFDYFQEGIKMSSDSIDLVMFGLGSMTILSGTLLAATVITTLVFAKFMLSILLAVGPIFIVLFLFGSTRRLFEAWLGQLISNVILIILFGLAVNLVMDVLWTVVVTHFQAYLVGRVLTLAIDFLTMGGSSSSTPNPVHGIGIALVCYVCHLFLQKVPAVADSIGRSLSLNTQTGLARK